MIRISIHVKDGDKTYELSVVKDDSCGWKFWLETEFCEGMALSEADLFGIFDKYFKEKF